MNKFKGLLFLGLTVLFLIVAINFGGSSQTNIMDNTIDPVPLPFSIEQTSTSDLSVE